MDYRFPADLQAYVDQMIASGAFSDVHELILDAVHRQREQQLTRRKKYEELRTAIQIGIDDLDHGRVVEGREVLKKLRQKLETETVSEV